MADTGLFIGEGAKKIPENPIKLKDMRSLGGGVPGGLPWIRNCFVYFIFKSDFWDSGVTTV